MSRDRRDRRGREGRRSPSLGSRIAGAAIGMVIGVVVGGFAALRMARRTRGVGLTTLLVMAGVPGIIFAVMGLIAGDRLWNRGDGRRF